MNKPLAFTVSLGIAFLLCLPLAMTKLPGLVVSLLGLAVFGLVASHAAWVAFERGRNPHSSKSLASGGRSGGNPPRVAETVQHGASDFPEVLP